MTMFVKDVKAKLEAVVEVLDRLDVKVNENKPQVHVMFLGRTLVGTYYAASVRVSILCYARWNEETIEAQYNEVFAALCDYDIIDSIRRAAQNNIVQFDIDVIQR